LIIGCRVTKLELELHKLQIGYDLNHKGDSAMSEWTDSKQRVNELMEDGYTVSDVWLHTEHDGSGTTLQLTLTKAGHPNESAKIRMGRVTSSIDDLSEFMDLWSKGNQPK
jgi:hypothetical protein